jgi:hypothetical protein
MIARSDNKNSFFIRGSIYDSSGRVNLIGGTFYLGIWLVIASSWVSCKLSYAQPGFLDLSSDLLLSIFAKLDPSSLAKVARVNKRTKALTHHPVLLETYSDLAKRLPISVSGKFTCLGRIDSIECWGNENLQRVKLKSKIKFFQAGDASIWGVNDRGVFLVQKPSTHRTGIFESHSTSHNRKTLSLFTPAKTMRLP